MTVLDDILARIREIEAKLGISAPTTAPPTSTPSGYDQLVTTVQQNTADIQTLKTQISQIQSILSSLPSASQISSLASQTQQNTSAISTLQSQISSIQSTLSSLSNLPAMVQSLSSTVSDLQSRLQSLYDTVSKCCGTTTPPPPSPTFTINTSVSPSGAGSVSPTSATLSQALTQQTFTATPNSGYQIDHWELDGTTLTNSQGVNAIMLTYDNLKNAGITSGTHILTAVFKQITTTPILITIDADVSPSDSGYVSPTSATLSQNITQRMFTVIPYSGYSIDHWEIDGKTISNSQGLRAITISIDQLKNMGITSGTHSLIAVLKQTTTPPPSPTFTINTSVSPYGTGSVSPSSATLSQTILQQTFTATPSSGYQLDHWELDGTTLTNSQGANTIMLTYDNLKNAGILSGTHVLTAVFKQVQQIIQPITITTSVSPSGAGSVSPTSITLSQALTQQTFTATPNSGYQIDHWELDGTTLANSQGVSAIMLTIDALKNSGITSGTHILTAVFKVVSTFINITANNGGSVIPSGTYDLSNIASLIQSGKVPTMITAVSPAPSCYGFDHWDLNGTNIGTGTTLSWDILKSATALKIGGNNTLTAMFKYMSLCNDIPVPKQSLCVSSAIGTKMFSWNYALIPFGAAPNIIPLTIKVHYPGSNYAPEECITGNGTLGSRVVTYAASDGAYFQATCSNGYKFSGKYSSYSLDSGTQYTPPSTQQISPSATQKTYIR
jgi:hypothetical protein